MPEIRETILTTCRPGGAVHIAPLGIIREGDGWIVAPFKPSRTLDNLRAHPFAVASVPADVRVFAGCLTGRKNWPLKPAERIAGSVLADALSHRELAVERIEEDDLRPRFLCRVVHEAGHRPSPGFNRAEGAVIEAAILASRLTMLPQDKIRAEMAYLEIAISKTAGPSEREAWGWLADRIYGFLEDSPE